MPRLLCIADAAPRLRLLAWALREEGFDAEECLPEAAVAQVGASPPDAVLVNCGEMTNDALARLVTRLLLIDGDLRIVILGDEAPGGDRVRYVPAPYRVADIVREITEGSADAMAT